MKGRMHALRVRGGGAFVKGRRGNPIVLTPSAVETILARGGRFGCRRFVEEHAERVERVDFESRGYVLDVDRPEELARWTTGPPMAGPSPEPSSR